MKRLILTALDDNNKIWFENLISFILSLRRTNYKGDIGIIDYGLSEVKKICLKEHDIKIFEPTYGCKELLLDRHISAADIAQNYNYDQIAVYDCDIWFPSHHLDIFEQIKNEKNLYATYDAWRCTFLDNCVESESKKTVSAKIDAVVSKNGYVWQVGVILGYKEAWLLYKQYIEEQLNIKNYLKPIYGVDTTLFNLYALDSEKVSFIHQKYNCPPVWGIELKHDEGNFAPLVKGEFVQGIHITRNHRNDKMLAYPYVFESYYHQEGKKFNLRESKIFNIIKSSLTCYPPAKENLTLELTQANANGGHFSSVISQSNDVYKPGCLMISVAGDSSFTLKNTHNHSVRLVFFCEKIIGFGACLSTYFIRENGDKFSPELQSLYYVDLVSNEEIQFCTKELDVEGKRIRWVFDNLRLI